MPPDAIRAALTELERRGLAQCRDGLWLLRAGGGGGWLSGAGCSSQSPNGRRRGRFAAPPGGEDPVVIQTTPHVPAHATRPPPAERGAGRERGRRRAGGSGPLAGQLRQMLRAGELDLPATGSRAHRPALGGAGRLGQSRPLPRAARRRARRRPRDPRRGRSRPGAGRSLRSLGIAFRWCRGAGSSRAGRPRAHRGDAVLLGRPGARPGAPRGRPRRRFVVHGTAARRRGRPRGRRRAGARQLVHRRDGGRRHAGRRLPTRWRSPTPIWSARPAGTSRARGSRSAVRASRPCGGAGPPGCSTACSATSARYRTRTSSPTSANCTPLWPHRTRCSRRPPRRSTTTRRRITASRSPTVRAAVERATREVLDRVPRIVGSGAAEPGRGPGPRAGRSRALRPAAPCGAGPRGAGRPGRRPVALGVSAPAPSARPGPSPRCTTGRRRWRSAVRRRSSLPGTTASRSSPPIPTTRRSARAAACRPCTGPAPQITLVGRHRRRGRLPGARRRRPGATWPGPRRRTGRGAAGAGARRRRCALAGACRTPGSTRAEPALRAALRPLLADADAYLAPVGRRPHPDHRAAGLAAADVAPVTAHGWAYPIWMWAWLTPDDPAVPWDRARLLRLDAAAPAAKRAAIAAFTSQVGPGPGRLTAGARRRHARPHRPDRRSCCSASPRTAPRPSSRFAELYAAGETRGGPTPGTSGASGPSCWRACRASGTARAFEPGCGTGELTRRAGGPLRRGPGLRPGRRGGPAGPRAHRGCPGSGSSGPRCRTPCRAEPVDLAVFSEVLYYLDDAAVAATLDRTLAALAPGGDVVVVHWRGWPPEAPRDAAATHRMLRARPELTTARRARRRRVRAARAAAPVTALAFRPDPPVTAVGVVVPARDEQDRIAPVPDQPAPCPRRGAGRRDHRRGGRARPLRGRHPGAGRRRGRRLARRPRSLTVPAAAAHRTWPRWVCPACAAAGSAPCVISACARVLDRLSGHPAAGTWLLSTDADTTVPPDWVRAHLRHAADGVHAVAGLADLAATDHLAAAALCALPRDRRARPARPHAPPRLRREPRCPRRRVPRRRRLSRPTGRRGPRAVAAPRRSRLHAGAAGRHPRADERAAARASRRRAGRPPARAAPDDHQAGHRAGDAICDGA